MKYDAGSTQVTTAGTSVQLSNTNDKVKVISVRARSKNKGDMYFGVSDVTSTNGWTLSPGEFTTPSLGDGSGLFSVFYVDAEKGGDYLDWQVVLR